MASCGATSGSLRTDRLYVGISTIVWRWPDPNLLLHEDTRMVTSQMKELLPAELHGKGLASPLQFEELYKFAQICHASGMFEDVTDVAQAFVKICRGAEMGIPPTTAMHGFDIIKKRLFVKP